MSFTTTWDDVVKIAPALASFPCESQPLILSQVETLLSEANLGSRYAMCCRYLAAHFGTLATRGDGAGGVVESEAVGTVSRSYAVPDLAPSALNATPFGAAYLNLIRSSPARFGFVT